MRVTNLLEQAAVPLMLIMLRAQVSRVALDGQWGIMVGVSLTRLVGGAVVGLLFATLLGLQGVTRQVAMVLVTEFDGDAELVSGVVLLSRMLSLITLPIILYFLMK